MNTYPPCPLCGCYIDDDHTIDGVSVCGSCHEDETYLRANVIDATPANDFPFEYGIPLTNDKVTV